MNYLNKTKLIIVGMFLATSTAFACPNGCDTNKCNKGVQQTKKCDTKKMCNKQGHTKGKTCHTKKRGAFLSTVTYALKHVGLTRDDWGDVKLAIAGYKKSCKTSGNTIPVKALANGTFNKAEYVKTSKLAKKLEAQADLLDIVMTILNEKQKKQFAMLIGAHQHTISLRGYFCATGKCESNKTCDTTKKCHTKNGKMCPKKQGKMCPKKQGKNCPKRH